MDEADVPIPGTCMEMCPESEVILRLTHDLVHYFERPPGLRHSERCARDKLRLVKEFRRPAPGSVTARPCDLRPADVLLTTINYLFNSIVPRSDVSWCRVYDFVFDRLRAVRQDMVIQRITGNEAIHILELIIRFLIYSGYRLCTETRDDFDPEINRSHVQECLKRLLVLYSSDLESDADRRAKGKSADLSSTDRCRQGVADNSSVCRCHQGEFVAIYLLYNLGSEEALLHALNLKQQLRSSDVFTTAYSLCLAWHTGNFVRALRLASRLPGLHLCALHHNIDHVRHYALRSMCVAIGNRAQSISIATLARLLACDGDAAETLCSACGLTPTDSAVSLSRSVFAEPTQKVRRPSHEIDSKLAVQSKSVSQLLQGKLCEQHCQVLHRLQKLEL